MYGNQDNEIGYDTITTGSYVTVIIENCLYKIDNDTYNGSSNHYVNSIKNVDPLFKDIDNNYYKLDSNSVAKDAGLLSITNLNTILNNDIEGHPRPAPGSPNPDMGAYEDDNQ
jgi:hypothetical protein